MLSLQVLSDMDTHRVQMNSHIFTAFLQACTVVPLAAHQIEAVFGAMASYRASQPPTAFVYTSLLTFCAKQAPDRALDVWQAMQEVGYCYAWSLAPDLCLQRPPQHSYRDMLAVQYDLLLVANNLDHAPCQLAGIARLHTVMSS